MIKPLLLLAALSSWAGTALAQSCPAPAVAADGPTTFCDDAVSLRTSPGPVRYAQSVLRFSTEYNSSWAAATTLGAPTVYPRYGDISGAWASSDPDDQREYLVLRFANPAPAKRILIWETYNPGAIDTVWVRNPNTNAWVSVYTATAAPAGGNSRILNINFPETAFNVQDVRLAINSPAVTGWNEIDAVALSGESAEYRWLRNGTLLPTTVAGTDGPGLSNIETSGAYSVRLTNNDACTNTSTPVNVLADTPPTVTVAPSTTTICSGGSVTLTSTVTNSGAVVDSRSLRFDGSNDMASAPHSASLNLTSALTLEAWINATGTGVAVQDVVNKSSNSQNTGYIFPRSDNNFNNLVLYLHINGSWRTFQVPYAALRGSWHHTAATYDGARVKIFIDGAKVLDVAQTGPVTTNTNALTLGIQPGFSEYYNGEADEIRVWNVARTEAQIAADYNKTIQAPQAGLVAYYRLDEGSGSTAADLSGNGNTMTLAANAAAPSWTTTNTGLSQGLTYQWSPATGLNSTTSPTVTANPTVSTTYTLRVTNVNSGCFDETTVRVNVGGPFTWSGAVSTNWFDAANWACGSVPNFGDDITIPASMPRYPVISSGSASVRNLTIQGGTLTMTDGTLSVMGTFTNNGTLDQTGGTIALMGGTLDDVGGTGQLQFRNLLVGVSGARMTSPVQITGLLSLAGNLNTNGRILTLVSNSAGTAMVYNNPGVVVGPVTVQRWINPSINPGRGYRHLSSPVQSSSIADLTAPGFAPVLNPAYNSAAEPTLVTPFPNIFTYNEMRLQPGSGNTFDTGWESPLSTSETLVPGRGYTVNLAPTTLDFVGTLTNGDVAVPLMRGAAAPGWNLVGNPYPSPLSWDAMQLPAGVDAAAYVYRSNGPYSGGYVAYVNGQGAPGTQLIPMGQAFFVRASSGSPTLTFRNPARVTTYQNPALNRGSDTRPQLQLALRRSGTPAEDVLYVYQEAGATEGFDSQFDALKIQLNGGQQPTLYQTSGTHSLAIQGLPTGQQPLRLPLGVHAPQAGAYSFAADQLLHFPATAQLWLEDRQSGTWHDLRQGAYAVQLSQGLHPTRFVLHLYAQRPLATATARLTNADLQVYPNPAHGQPVTVSAAGLSGSRAELHLLNSLGQVVRKETVALNGRLLEHQVEVAGLPAGVYTLQLRTPAGTLARKLVVN
ncbi:LamG-like jellyroll fold domain-containing protein [Hymenobacter sp. B81]|uniref:LamG-like jellyroll fold domain-containing protein n=1 Tax=Hymenobacter sp. B81 TaxID=3344878 RepID=UPI0037DC37EE